MIAFDNNFKRQQSLAYFWTDDVYWVSLLTTSLSYDNTELYSFEHIDINDTIFWIDFAIYASLGWSLNSRSNIAINVWLRIKIVPLEYCENLTTNKPAVIVHISRWGVNFC